MRDFTLPAFPVCILTTNGNGLVDGTEFEPIGDAGRKMPRIHTVSTRTNLEIEFDQPGGELVDVTIKDSSQSSWCPTTLKIRDQVRCLVPDCTPLLISRYQLGQKVDVALDVSLKPRPFFRPQLEKPHQGPIPA